MPEKVKEQALVIDGVVISRCYFYEILEFVNTHKITTFDQWVDYPSPIYKIVWRGLEFVSREMDYLAMKIIESEVKAYDN